MNFRVPCLILLGPLPAFGQAPAPVAAAAVAPAPTSTPEPAPAGPRPPTHPLRLAFTSSSAFGLSNAGFFNQLVGVRLDYRFTSRFAFGGALAYANLKGKSERVHNALPEAVLEYRIPIAGDAFGMPLRFAPGFLPKNGPTLRVSAGLDFALSQRLSLDVMPLEPMVWVNRERPEVSLNGSLALRIGF